MKYDTAEIRAVARRLKSCAASVNSLTTRDMRQLTERVETEFRGEAADALGERLREFRSDVRRIGEGLDTIGAELMAYARRLDLADEESKREIQKQ